MSISKKEIWGALAAAAVLFTADTARKVEQADEEPFPAAFDRACPEALGTARQGCLRQKQREVHEHCRELLKEIDDRQFDKTYFELRALGDIDAHGEKKALSLGFALTAYCDVPGQQVLGKLKPAIAKQNDAIAYEALRWIDFECDATAALRLQGADGGQTTTMALKERTKCPSKMARESGMSIENIRLVASHKTIQTIRSLHGLIISTRPTIAKALLDEDTINRYIDAISFLPIDETTKELFKPLVVDNFADFKYLYIDVVCEDIQEKLGEDAPMYIKELRAIWEKKTKPAATSKLNGDGY